MFIVNSLFHAFFKKFIEQCIFIVKSLLNEFLYETHHWINFYSKIIVQRIVYIKLIAQSIFW